MSVLIASFVDKGRTLFMGADSRACVQVNGINYQDNDKTTKLYDDSKNLVFYCSGVIQMSNEVADILLSQDSFDHHFIIKLLKDTYSKHVKLNPEIADIPHALQFVIPNKDKNDGTWEIAFMDSDDDFIPHVYAQNPDQNHFVFAIGTGGKIIHPIIDEGLEQTGQLNVVSLYHEAFSAGSSEECGGTLKVIGFMDDQILKKEIPINDCREIRKMLKHAVGDGVIVTPDNKNVSGVASITKPNGSFDITYRNSNFAKERRLIMQDSGVELSTETGDIVIGHDVGSYIKLKASGDIEIHAMGKIYHTGTEYNFE